MGSKPGNKFSRSLIDKLDGEHHRILQQLRKAGANSHCAECGDNGTTWASVNIGAFLCVRCADVHRGLGTHVSKVKGCRGTYLWGPDEIARMQEMGNAAMGAECGNSSASRPAQTATKEERMEICRRKYEQRVWARPVEKSCQLQTETFSASFPVAPAQRVAVLPSETSLLDDLFKDFAPEVTPPAKHSASEQNQCFRMGTPCEAAKPRGHQTVEASLFDELFKNFDAEIDRHSLGDTSTAPSDDEPSQSRNCWEGALASAVVLPVSQAPSAAIPSAYQSQLDARIWDGFGY